MKYWIAVIFLAVVTASCTKTKTVTVTTPPIHDTTQIIVRDTININKLIGKWHNDTYSNLNPTFTADSFTFAGYTTAYLASSDTIYQQYSGTTIAAFFAYAISANSDSLILSNNSYGVVKYYRTN